MRLAVVAVPTADIDRDGNGWAARRTSAHA